MLETGNILQIPFSFPGSEKIFSRGKIEGRAFIIPSPSVITSSSDAPL